MTTRDDVLERLAQATGHPWGPARSNLVAEAVTWADSLDDEDLAIEARLALAVSYYQGNEEWKGLAPFVWLLDRHAERPDLFDARRIHEMFWNYKWAIHVAADNPAVGAAQLAQLQDGLEEFYRSQGASMHVVHGERHDAAVALGREDVAAAELAAWRATPRDESSDCEGCDPMRQVNWATAHGDWELAVATAVPVLDEVVGCAVQPARMQAAVLLALLYSGRPKAAWDAHVRSYRQLRGQPQFMSAMGQHMEFLALTGRIGRGLRIMRECLRITDQAESTAVLMGLLGGAAVLLREAERAGLGEEALGVEVPGESVWCPGPTLSATTTISQARSELTDRARRMAALYDARNGNAVVSDRLEARLAREPIVDVEEVASRGALAEAGAEPLEPSEELPEGISIGEDEDGADAAEYLKGVTLMPGLLSDDGGAGDGGGTGAAGADGAGAGAAGAAGDDESDPYPVVDLRVPVPPRDGLEAIERLRAQRSRPGGNIESLYIGCQAIARDLLPDPEQVPPDLAETAWMARAAEAEIAWDDDSAVEHRLRGRALLDEQSQDLRCLYIDLSIISLEHRADVRAERVSTEATTDRLERAGALAARLAERVEELLEAPEGRQDELVEAYDASTALVGLLPDLGEIEGAAESLEQARRIAPHVAHLVDPVDGELVDQLDLMQAELDLDRDKPYEACVLADEVLRRHDPCPVIVASSAHLILAHASANVAEHDEAVRQLREYLNTFLAVGLTPMTGPVFAALAGALGASGRVLEAAEVLETGLSGDVPEAVADRLRTVLVTALDDLDEEEGVVTNALLVAERALSRGETSRGLEYLVKAANAAGNMSDNSRAASLFRRAAELEDPSDSPGRIRRSRLLRRVARALVLNPTLAMSRANLEECREIMAQAYELIADVPDTRRYSAAYEIGDWHDDMAWILWQTDENSEAVDHCERAFSGYMSTQDRDSAARPLSLLVRLHAERGEVEQARAAIARVRELLAHRRWADHPALAMVSEVEASFED